ncbi:response regulator [Roseofilum sp. BLCC_M154]|uniref:Response regulator n=1 Tax=Roseofilum acuticapitatum BLCC-M154 TaxID=3022444 RepID=A0ABT7ASX3_9CYAN|nr:response regulator [Roseofilum acuticapitatum]MDJ1170004.1 response regulator [Roseofilum acuticapitatum BLCC-M154]
MSKPMILCVDDESVVLNSLKIQLKNAFLDNYLYELAESADEAWEIIEDIKDSENQLIVIVSDWLMPGVKGDEFLINVHQKFPKVIKVMLTGQADYLAIERARKYANLYQYISKPWTQDELIETIKSGLQQVKMYDLDRAEKA